MDRLSTLVIILTSVSSWGYRRKRGDVIDKDFQGIPLTGWQKVDNQSRYIERLLGDIKLCN